MEEVCETLCNVFRMADEFDLELEKDLEEITASLRAKLFDSSNISGDAAKASPQQNKKRAKKLSTIKDITEQVETITIKSDNNLSNTLAQFSEIKPKIEADDDYVFRRPTRAAKKKETLRKNTRQKENFDSNQQIAELLEVPSQVSVKAETGQSNGEKPNTSVEVISNKLSVVVLTSEDEDEAHIVPSGRSSKVNIKKEKISISQVSCETNVISSTKTEQTEISSNGIKDSTSQNAGYRTRRKKKLEHRPIKEERSLTRSSNKSESQYEDAVDHLDKNMPSTLITETFAVPTVKPLNETFAADPVVEKVVPPLPVACDSTFTVAAVNEEKCVENKEPTGDSLITEDESFEKPVAKPVNPVPQLSVLSKFLNQKPSKQKELFNPCIQSPVKKKVEAFEHHANIANIGGSQPLMTRSKRAKENVEKKPTSRLTPLLSKPTKFLTPLASSNVTPSMNEIRKLPNSASKALPFPVSKHLSSNLKNANSTNTFSRENSDDDIRKCINKQQQAAEERKKKRELKHQQAALSREAKEKERTERLKKAMKEREEKLKKKIIEASKKPEAHDIHRNIKPTEDPKLPTAKVVTNEIPPQQKLQQSYDFKMLHSDDSTDDEEKTTTKRPQPPLWSIPKNRVKSLKSQDYISIDIIDNLYSVQPMTANLEDIFPDIDPRHLRRNSSAIWDTPTRYSELPKY